MNLCACFLNIHSGFFEDFFEILPVLCEIKCFHVSYRYKVENHLSIPVIKEAGDIILKTKLMNKFCEHG